MENRNHIMPTFRAIAKRPQDKNYTGFNVKTESQVEFRVDTTIYHLDDDATEQEKIDFHSEKEHEFKWMGRRLNLEIKLQAIGRF
jgi:hypothetical protein